MINIIAPSKKPIIPKKPSKHKIIVEMSMTRTSFLFRSSFFRQIGDIVAATPRTSKILAILLPITFPMAISGESLRTAPIETVISGIEVPKPTMTELTNILEIFKFLATDIEPAIKDSPPKYKITNPNNMLKMSTRF